MFCPKCGAQNADGAAFCSSCGAALSAAPQPAAAGPIQGSPRTGKSPLIAAFLNLFFGLGYVYLGVKKVLGVPTIGFVLIALVIFIVLGRFTLGLASLVFAILLAVDGWQKGGGGKGFISAE
ncbi:MAG: zinc-ribbon domain-containing protein [Thaumarchaeota archaeon]|nr:zinc-ribbon domain-containing protein [Nitrososphaerota archaeon]